MISPKTVPIKIPQAAAVPIERLPIAPAPEAIHNGISPEMKANEVIKIGLKRSLAPSIAASVMP